MVYIPLPLCNHINYVLICHSLSLKGFEFLLNRIITLKVRKIEKSKKVLCLMNKIVLIDICWFESRYIKRAFSRLHGCKVELFSLEHLLQSELHKIQIDFEFFAIMQRSAIIQLSWVYGSAHYMMMMSLLCFAILTFMQ